MTLNRWNARAVLLALLASLWMALGSSVGADEADDMSAIVKQLIELCRAEKYQQAIPIAEKILHLKEKALGADHPDTATILTILAGIHRSMDNYAMAEPLYKRALAINEKALGADHADTAQSLNNLAGVYRSMGNYGKAEPLYERALTICEKALGADHPETATSLNNLAGVYRSVGNYPKAERLLERVLAIREKAFGENPQDMDATLNNLADLYRSVGNYAKAEPLLERALAIREKALGANHLGTATGLNNLAELYRSMANFAKAEPLFERALAIREKTWGVEHPDTDLSLNNLAGIYESVGNSAKAEPLYKRSLAINEKASGADHPYTAASLSKLARVYRSMGNYAKAEPLYERSLAINEKVLGIEHLATATSLNDLAGLYSSMGNYAKAEPLYEQSLAIYKKALGADHPDTATSLNNLALLYVSMGSYEKAEPLLERALAIREKALGADHPDTAAGLNNLADLYRSMGNFAKAEPLFKRALAIWEKALGADHPGTATGLNNLAELYRSIANLPKAEPLLERALAIREKALGADHPDTATSLNNLANLYHAMANYPRAEPLLERALAISEKALGADHPDTAMSLNNLAGLYSSMGNYAKAEPLFERALAIWEKALGADHPDTATSLNNLAKLYHSMGNYTKAEPLFVRALAIREKAWGAEHPDSAKSLSDLAFLQLDTDKPAAALKLAVRKEHADEKTLANVLSFSSEQQRSEFQKKQTPYTLPGTLGDAPLIALTLLHHKGVVLDSLLEDRLLAEASKDAKQREVIEQLRAAKQRYTQLLMEVPKDFSVETRQRRERELENRAKQAEQIEATLARQVSGLGGARRALSVTLAQVQGALAADQVLVELLRYDHYLGKNKWETRYGTVLIASSGEPKWVPLGAAAEIEKTGALYRKSVRGQTDETTLHSALRTLHDQVWAPIQKALPASIRTIILSPDSELSFVSFATLVNERDEFLGAKYSIRYVTSGRDLLREQEPSTGGLMAMFGNPEFGAEATQLAQTVTTGDPLAMRALEMRDFENMLLPPLPGTAQECAALESQAKAGGKPSRVFLGAKATEAQLRAVKSPRILHLATHGFFLPETKDGNTDSDRGHGFGALSPIGFMGENRKSKVILKNPMHRSGVALAGAQRTLEAWAKGEVPPSDNDGILTAEEAGGLHLKGTWLVTLSACDTGGGEARSGEGVLGLRRGFIQAGAQNLLMTLWPVSDQTTVEIMKDFYAVAQKTGNAPQALAEVQRDWLIKLRKDKGLLEAVRLAGPFIMNSQGTH